MTASLFDELPDSEKPEGPCCERVTCQAVWATRHLSRDHPHLLREYRKAIKKIEQAKPAPAHLPALGERVEFELDGLVYEGRVMERSNTRLRKSSAWMARLESEMPDGSVVSSWLGEWAFHSSPARQVYVTKNRSWAHDLPTRGDSQL
jgi:hypothetical protein